MRIFGYTIIKTACYEAEKKRVERMTLGFQQERASNERCIEHLLEKIARLEEGSDEEFERRCRVANARKEE